MDKPLSSFDAKVDSVDHDTERAARRFLARISGQFNIAGAILFGSRARHTHSPDSDADVAVLLRPPYAERFDMATDMAGIAFDVLLDTGILVQALPLWEEEFDHPELFSNPQLIKNVRREGRRL